jgi:tRNA-dihydrouridine synthase B
MFSWQAQKKPLLLLAPMAGYTDSAYRQLVKSIVPSVIVVSEFVSSDAIKYRSKKTFRMLEFDAAEQPLIVQIFGKRPENFAESARVLESLGVAGVDINMGCPARKVVSSDHGSALLKNPKLAAEIITATVQATKLPVSVKMRLGTSNADGIIEFAKMVEDCGAQMLAIHGRTAKQMYLGTADYEPIYRVKETLKIPVIGNGDVTSAESFAAKLGNLDGLMVGRATIGNPWVMAEIETYLTKNERPKSKELTLAEKLPVILRHCELSVATKGEQLGMLEMRKYLAGYVRGEPGAREVRAKLVRVETVTAAKQILEEFVTTPRDSLTA